MRQVGLKNTEPSPQSQVAFGLGNAFPYWADFFAQNRFWGRLFLCLLCVSFFPVFTYATPLTGSRLKAALDKPAERSWTEVPLRETFNRLGEDCRVSIFLDRRVDPGQETSLDALTLPLRETLAQLADMINTELVQFGSIVYIGPEETAGWLPIVAAERRDDVRKMPDRGRAMLTPKSMQWDDLATPRQLIEALSEETGVSIGPIEVIPHDLWAAAELPRTSPVDRLTLILSQFDKTFVLATDASGKPQLQIIDVPDDVKEQAKRAQPSKSTTPPAGTTTQGKKSSGGSSINLARLRIKRFAVQEKPVGVVIEYLARQWNLKLEVDRQKFGEKLQQRISVTKEEATVPELIQAILSPVGLKGELDETTGVLRIH